MRKTIMLLVAGLAVAAAVPHASAADSEQGVQLSQCIVSLIDDIDIPAQAAGVLVDLTVKEGVTVEQQMKLGQIDERDIRVQLVAAEAKRRIAQLQADSNASVLVAEKMVGVSTAEYQKSVEINQRTPGSISTFEIERLKFQVERSEAQEEVARMEKEVARENVMVEQAAVDAAQNELQRRQIEAPVTGVVEKIYRRVGEWVSPGDPIMKVLRMDRLRVEGFVDAGRFLPQQIHGSPVVVQVDMGGGVVRTFKGKIEFVSPRVEGSGDYLVWAEIDNVFENGHWVLRPGQPAEMTIRLAGQPVPAPVADRGR